jgi:hypothetical protein
LQLRRLWGRLLLEETEHGASGGLRDRLRGPRLYNLPLGAL